MTSIPGTVLQPAAPPRRRRGLRRRRARSGPRGEWGPSGPAGAARSWTGLVVTAAAVAVGGPLMGVAWWLLAPTAVARAQGGQVFLTGHQELQIAQDGWFAVVVGAAGVLTGTVLALRPSRRPAVQSLLAAAGLALAALVAWRVGTWLGPAPLIEQVRAGSTNPVTPLTLRMPGPLLALGPLLFSMTRFAAALLTGDPPVAEHSR